MNCTVQQRRAVERAVDEIRNCEATETADVISPSESRHDRWTIDAIVAGECVPSEILTELALEGLSLHQQPPKVGHQVVVATA